MPAAKPKPSRQELCELYYHRRLTLREIGDVWDVTATCIMRWMQSYGIERRPSRGLAYRGQEQPTAEQLYQWTHVDGLLQREIGEMYGVGPDTVSQWLQNHGIPRRSLRDRPSADELYRLMHLEHLTQDQIAERWSTSQSNVGRWAKELGVPTATGQSTIRKQVGWTRPDADTVHRLYIDEHLTYERIAEIYNVTTGAVAQWLRRYGIQARPNTYSGERFICNDGHEVMSSYEQLVDNWLYTNHIAHVYEPPLPFGQGMKADFLANGWYVEVWGVDKYADYEERKQRKIKGYEEYGLPLVQIPRWAFKNKPGGLWMRKLSKCLTDHDAVSPLQNELPLHQTPVSGSSAEDGPL